MPREPRDGGPKGRQATAQAAAIQARVRQAAANLEQLRRRLETKVALAGEASASHEQIARALGISRARVSQMIDRAKSGVATARAAPQPRSATTAAKAKPKARSTASRRSR